MKRVFLFLFILSFPVTLSAQYYGDGTSINTAYYGVINSSYPMQTWNTTNYPGGVIYVGRTTSGQNDLEVGTGGTLTITQGITIKFCTTESDLRITGSGVLSAIGNSSSSIIFTKDTNGSWGHISFESMGAAGASSLKYCIIEYGRKNGALGTLESVGGGLQTDFNSITISKCTFRYNYAFFGGGIFVNANKSPSIDSCIFLGNTAREAGGAIYLYNGSSTVITNCIFDDNYATGTLATYYSGGAIQFGLSITDAKAINCTFVNNRSDRTGDAFYTLSGGSVVNSIFWGSSDQLGFYSSSGLIDHSAIQGYVSGSHFTNCFEINSSNTGTLQLPGPYFTATNGTDWSIQFVSPCRDVGTSSGAPSTDYLGKSRIGNYDIGAYEVQYSRWTGEATDNLWSTESNWDKSVDPASGTGDVIIPSGLTYYPTGNSSQNFAIGSGKIMILYPGAKATFGTLTNNGSLNLESAASGMFSLMFNDYSGSGIVNSEIYFTGGDADPPNGAYSWHYTAVPETMSKTGLTSLIVDQNNVNLLRYDDSGVTTDKYQGWQWHDGYDGTTSFSDLDIKRGYNFYRKTTDASTAVLTSSTLLSDLGTISLQFKTGIPVWLAGWNLLGNSLTCTLDWKKVDFSNGPNVRNAVYYTKNNIVAAFVDGDGVRGGTQFVPPLQGFFVKVTATGQSLNFTGAKVHSDQTYYKKKGATITPQVRLEIWHGNMKDETVIRLKDESTTLFDDKYDASNWVSSAAIGQIYTKLSTEDYSINTIPFPEIKTEVPVVIVIPSDGTYSIKRTVISGLDNYKIYLKDLQQNITIDLNDVSEYSFNASKGTIENQFILIISNILTGSEVLNTSKSAFNIFQAYSVLNLQTLGDEWDGKSGSVKVFDLTGKTVSYQKDVEFWKNTINQIPATFTKGVYFVEIKSGAMRYVGKVVIR